jgi:hypothetical protein
MGPPWPISVVGGDGDQDWRRPLVWLVVAIFLVGVVVAAFVADARQPSYALQSELVYRLEIAAVAVGTLLFVVTTLRLASFGRTYTSFGAGPVTTGAEDPTTSMKAAVVDVEEIGTEMERIAGGLADLVERVAVLEDHLWPRNHP